MRIKKILLQLRLITMTFKKRLQEYLSASQKKKDEAKATESESESNSSEEKSEGSPTKEQK